jgi:peptide/nickel transport system substrate-binding protein
VAILPTHILEKVPPRNMKIAEFSTKPVGTGPYSFSALKKIRNSEEISLTANDNYFIKKPYIRNFVIKTYLESKDMIDGYAKREVDGIEKVSYDQIASQNKLPKIHLYQIATPESDILFFNLRQGTEQDLALRQAILMTVDRKTIATQAYHGYAVPIYSPILPGFSTIVSKLRQPVDLAGAKKKLSDAGYLAGSDGILKKGTTRVSLRLLTSDDSQKSVEAEAIATELKQIGVESKIEKYPLNALVQDHIRPRDFDMLLVSENLGSDPDLYPFWDSTQSADPGLNFSGYSDRKLDKLIEQARGTNDQTLRTQKYEAAEQIIWDNVPAIYLVRPEYEYGVTDQIYGVDLTRIAKPTERFWNVEQWFINTTTDKNLSGS